MHHQFRALQQPSDVDAHECRRDQAHIRETGISAADVRRAEEHLTEPLALGNLLKRRTMIGDGHEVTAGMRLADGGFHALQEIFEQEDGLQSRA